MSIRTYYDNFNNEYFKNVQEQGTLIYTSGSSGKPKPIYQPPEKIKVNNKIACEVQGIKKDSIIYTCLRPTRAGGLFAQTLPGLDVGATIDLAKFDPYEYVKVADKYTHTHLTPKQAKGVILTKGFKNLNLTDKVFLVGSEPVTYDIIDAFINQGAKVILIWGMTEIGPNAIMHILNGIDDVNALKEITPPNSTPLGNIFNCQWRIDDDRCLWVRGNLSVYKEWYNTYDEVIEKDGHLFYTGRQGTPVDFNKPRKG